MFIKRNPLVNPFYLNQVANCCIEILVNGLFNEQVTYNIVNTKPIQKSADINNQSF